MVWMATRGKAVKPAELMIIITADHLAATPPPPLSYSSYISKLKEVFTPLHRKLFLYIKRMVFNYKRLLERLDMNLKQFKNASSKTPELFIQHQILLNSNLNKSSVIIKFIINCMWMVHNVKVHHIFIQIKFVTVILTEAI